MPISDCFLGRARNPNPMIGRSGPMRSRKACGMPLYEGRLHEKTSGLRDEERHFRLAPEARPTYRFATTRRIDGSRSAPVTLSRSGWLQAMSSPRAVHSTQETRAEASSDMTASTCPAGSPQFTRNVLPKLIPASSLKETWFSTGRSTYPY